MSLIDNFFGFFIDIEIGATYHGKDVLYRLNSVYKHYLMGCMKIYDPERKTKTKINPHYSTVSVFSNLAQKLIFKLSDKKNQSSLARASKYRSNISAKETQQQNVPS